MANILSIGQSALNAANVAIATTGHNIANAATPGYSRQSVQQAALAGQISGPGYVGKGVEVSAIKRVYNEFLNSQVMSAQTTKSQLETYYTQIRQIDNMLADSSVGLSPSLQEFFAGVQNLTGGASSLATRQSLLSSSEALVARFQGLDAQLTEMRKGVNDQIVASANAINTYSQQIAALNEAIEKSPGIVDGIMPNDLLDQRDHLIAELSKEVRVSVVKQGYNYDIYIGNGQPLVVGGTTFGLQAVPSLTDPGRMQIGYETNGNTVILAESGLTGGNLAGLFEFRSKTLDVAQNSLGRIAITLASDFNAQHRLGMDLNGNQGGDYFTIASPVVTAGSTNKGSGTPTATITNAGKLSTSDYQLQFDGSQYVVTRLPQGTVATLANGDPARLNPSAFPVEIDGVTFNVAGMTPSAGDRFLIQPTVTGAAGISVAVNDVSTIAAAAPIKTAASSANTGTATISAGTVNSTLTSWNNLLQPVSIVFDSATTYRIGSDPTVRTYSAGSDISFNGWTVQISGEPKAGDTFAISSNAGGTADNRNALLLGKLQTSNRVANGTANYQGAYSQLVNLVGNKTAELQSTSAAADKLLTQATEAQQAVSGVNLDEEAANLLRYQQAYQAAAKVMKTASDLFDTLLALGN